MSARLAFLGPRGTYTEEAALAYNPSAELVPCATISSVAAAVAAASADSGIVPIENSLEGSVNETLDILVQGDQLHIRDELILRIDHHLLARPGLRMEDLRVIYSHPQALGQCRRYIEAKFPSAQIVAALSTAAAVADVMMRGDAAAIGNQRAAALYGAATLDSRIQDSENNYTRFVVLSPQDHVPTGQDKTSLAFTFAVADRPGLLVSVLNGFAERGINLSKIESRPGGQRLGVYVFLVDIDGHRQDALLADVLQQVGALCSFFRILGSYPRCPLPR